MAVIGLAEVTHHHQRCTYAILMMGVSIYRRSAVITLPAG
ncbi:Uncharacterised protein [Budvicia aquatica]|uniref:Uncharacterized protein n=1 Tax=Budvicia aquatica TaxID=82979 RepID=A0A484ZTU4_9GAMM|nr:Uncharacterised protein [Budvicia aquatica]